MKVKRFNNEELLADKPIINIDTTSSDKDYK